jgi:transposase
LDKSSIKNSSLAEKRQGKQLKKYWKLLQKNQKKLDSLTRRGALRLKLI